MEILYLAVKNNHGLHVRSTFHPEGYQSAITNFIRSFTNYRSEPFTPATMTSSGEGEGGEE